MTFEETTTRRRTFRRARRAAREYRTTISSFESLARAFTILVLWFPRLAVAAVPPYMATATVPAYLARQLPNLPRGGLFGYLVFEAVAFYLLVGLFTGPVTEWLAGDRPGVVRFVSAGARSLLTTVAVAAALGLLVALGWILLVVPGIFVGLLGFVAIPVAAHEQLGAFPAFKRSARLMVRATDIIGPLILLGAFGPAMQWLLFGVPQAPGMADLTTLEGLGREACYFVPFLLAAILPTVVFDELSRG